MALQADSIKPEGQTGPQLLPCLPHVLLNLLEHAESGDTGHWVNGIGNDPALAAHVLFAALQRSGTGDAPRTVEQAVAAVGTDACHSIVHNAAIRSVFNSGNSQRIAGLKRHWWRGILCANLARQIAGQVGYAAPEEARLGTLLLTVRQPSFPTNADSDGLGDDPESGPGEPGASGMAEPSANPLCGPDLPPFLGDAIKFHREHPERIVESHPLVRIVWLANAYTDHLTGTAPLSSDAAQLLFEAAPDLRLAASNAQQATEAVAKTFGIELDAPLVPAPATIINERRQFRSIPAPLPERAGNHCGELPSDVLIRHRLAREVRDLAMMNGIAVSLGSLGRRQDRLAGCAKAAHALFGLAPPLFFLPAGNDTLRAQPMPGQPSGAEAFTVPARGGRSICAQAAAQQAMLDSFSTRPALVLDEQIAQMLNREGVLYLPISTRGALAGMAAFGIASQDLPRIRKRQRLFARFARFCAHILQEPETSTARVEAEADSALPVLRGEIRRAVHEANNPLSIMKNYVRLLTTRLEEDPTASNGLRIIGEEIDRIATTLRALTSSASADSGRHIDQGDMVDINGVIRDMLGLARDTLFAPARIFVVTHFADKLPLVVTQRNQLKQILLNLLKNAAEAMPEGGTVTISTRDNVNRDGQPYVEITVSDTGPGLPPKVMESLFKPVASTKGAGHSGLGISIVGELATLLNISVTCTSDPSGTIFQLLVPRALADSARPPGHSGTT